MFNTGGEGGGARCQFGGKERRGRSLSEEVFSCIVSTAILLTWVVFYQRPFVPSINAFTPVLLMVLAVYDVLI